MYQFDLESVLKYRKGLEDRLVREFGELMSALKEAENNLRDLQDSLKATAGSLADEEREGISAKKAALYSASMRGFRARIADQERLVAELKKGIEQSRQKVVEASRERKVVEKLKEKDKKRYSEDLRKKELKEMDDVAGKKHHRKGGGGGSG